MLHFTSNFCIQAKIVLFVKLKLFENDSIDLLNISKLKMFQKNNRFHQKPCELLGSKHVRSKSGQPVSSDKTEKQKHEKKTNLHYTGCPDLVSTTLKRNCVIPIRNKNIL